MISVSGKRIKNAKIDESNGALYLNLACPIHLGRVPPLYPFCTTSYYPGFHRLFYLAGCRPYQHIFTSRLLHQPALSLLSTLQSHRASRSTPGCPAIALYYSQLDFTIIAQLEYLYRHRDLRCRDCYRGSIIGQEMKNDPQGTTKLLA